MVLVKVQVEEHKGQGVSRVRSLLPDLLALAALAALVAVFFAPILFLPDRWMPEGGGDLSGFMYPYIRYATETLRTLHVPLWNPYLYSGAPFLADIQSSVFYPATLLLALLPIQVTYRELELVSVFHFWWAGAAMYITLRGWYRPALIRAAALFGAAAFALSDVFFTHFGNLNLIAGASWLPLVLLGVRLGGVGGVLLGAAALALSALAGHTQPLVMILLAIIVYGAVALGGWLIRRIRQSKSNDASHNLKPALFALIGIPLLGLGMAALVLLPAFELTQLTRRAGLTYAEAAAFSLPVQALIGIVAPHLHGRGPAGFWGSWPRVEVGYLGVFPLLLAAVGLTRSRRAVFWAALTILAIALALGPATPLHGLFYQWVPGMAQLRAPARLMLLADFGLAGLAALGLDTLVQRPRPWLGWLAVGAAAVLATALLFAYSHLAAVGKPTAAQLVVARNALWAGLALLGIDAVVILLGVYGKLRGTLLVALILGLLAVDLVGQGIGVDVGRSDPTANYDHPAAVDFLNQDASLYRLEVRGESWSAWAPNLSLAERLYDVAGIYNPLEVADYQLYWEGLTDRATPLYDFLNAKYIVAPKDFALPWDKFTPVFDGDPSVNIYLNTRALPRAQVVYRSRVIPDSAAAFAALRAPGFDPSQETILSAGDTLNSAPNGETNLSIAEYEPQSIVVDVTTTADAYVVFSEVAYPGWTATVDDKPAPIERANFAFRAVRVPSGEHRVAMRFEPTSWRLGLLISGLSAAAYAGLAIFTYRIRQRWPQRHREHRANRIIQFFLCVLCASVAVSFFPLSGLHCHRPDFRRAVTSWVCRETLARPPVVPTDLNAQRPRPCVLSDLRLDARDDALAGRPIRRCIATAEGRPVELPDETAIRRDKVDEDVEVGRGGLERLPLQRHADAASRLRHARLDLCSNQAHVLTKGYGRHRVDRRRVSRVEVIDEQGGRAVGVGDVGAAQGPSLAEGLAVLRLPAFHDVARVALWGQHNAVAWVEGARRVGAVDQANHRLVPHAGRDVGRPLGHLGGDSIAPVEGRAAIDIVDLGRAGVAPKKVPA